jgi:hypothetical protein
MMRSLQPRTFNAGMALAAGLVLGLVVGLLIGWVIWPVEWQGATISELYPEEKAEYLAAVAEGYVIYSSTEAAESARRRVAGFGDNLATELEAAIGHFSSSDDPNKAVRISNLTSLAAALGVTLPNLVGVTQADAAAPAAEGAGGAATPVITPASGEGADTAGNTTSETATEAAPESGGIGWARWLLIALVAIVLLLGGIYLLLYLARQRGDSAGDDQIETVIDREIGALRPQAEGTGNSRFVAGTAPIVTEREPDRGPEFTRYANNGIGAEDEEVPPLRQPKPGNPPDAEPDEYQFDDDPEDYTTFVAGQSGGSANRASHYTPFPLESGRTTVHRPPAELEVEDDEDDLWEEDESPPAAPQPPPLAPTSSRAATALSGGTAESGNRTGAAGAPSPRPVTYGRGAARSKLLEIYTAHYHSSIRDYDEAHPITDTQSGRYIGECGMGVSNKHGVLPNNPDQVVALEVWLFDKTDDKNMGSQTRVLLSEYAIDHNLDQAFLRERQDDPRPFTAQPNVRFQLESQNLMLDCTIIEAVYVASGPTKGVFQSVKVEMTVHKKS